MRIPIFSLIASGILFTMSVPSWAMPPGPSFANVEIIDSSGDGAGNTLGEPDGIAVDANENVYVVGLLTDNAFRITPAGTITEIIDATGDGSGHLLNQPRAVAVDSNGNVYVTGNFSNNAFRIAASGTCSTTGTPCTITEIINASGAPIGRLLTGPRAIAVDSGGNVFVAGSDSNRVFKIATPTTCRTSGTKCTITEIIDGPGDLAGNSLDEPEGVAVDLAGNVYVAGNGTDNAFKIAAPGTCTVTGTPCTITEIIDTVGDGVGNVLTGARGVAVDSAGDVYVSGEFSKNVFKIAAPTTCATTGTPCAISEIIDETGDGAGNTIGGASAVAIDSNDNVYVAGDSTRNAFEIATPGTCSTTGTQCTITEIIDESVDDCSGKSLSSTRAIAVDPSGNAYVTGAFTNNAFKILPFLQSPCTGGPVLFEWSGVVPAAGSGVLTNPNVSPGESWTLSYTLLSTLPDSNSENSAIGVYIDSAIAPTISFSGGYSTPVGGVPGISAEVWLGIGHALSANSISGDLFVWVWQSGGTFSDDSFPPDGAYSTAVFPGTPAFRLTNADGEISYTDAESFSAVTITTLPTALPSASFAVRLLIAFSLIAASLRVLKTRKVRL